MTFRAVHLVPCPAGYAVIDENDGYLLVEGLTQVQAQQIVRGPIEVKAGGRGLDLRVWPRTPTTARGKYAERYREWLEEAER